MWTHSMSIETPALAWCLDIFWSLQALVGTFNNGKALVGTFSEYCENFAKLRWQLYHWPLTQQTKQGGGMQRFFTKLPNLVTFLLRDTEKTQYTINETLFLQGKLYFCSVVTIVISVNGSWQKVQALSSLIVDVSPPSENIFLHFNESNLLVIVSGGAAPAARLSPWFRCKL